jgi:hypothetical protein
MRFLQQETPQDFRRAVASPVQSQGRAGRHTPSTGKARAAGGKGKRKDGGRRRSSSRPRRSSSRGGHGHGSGRPRSKSRSRQRGRAEHERGRVDSEDDMGLDYDMDAAAAVHVNGREVWGRSASPPVFRGGYRTPVRAMVSRRASSSMSARISAAHLALPLLLRGRFCRCFARDCAGAAAGLWRRVGARPVQCSAAVVVAGQSRRGACHRPCRRTVSAPVVMSDRVLVCSSVDTIAVARQRRRTPCL